MMSSSISRLVVDEIKNLMFVVRDDSDNVGTLLHHSIFNKKK